MSTGQSLAHEIALLIPDGGKPRWSGSGYLVRCPGHDDHDPSLHFSIRNGRVLFFCFGPCAQMHVWWSLPQEARDRIAPAKGRGTTPGRPKPLGAKPAQQMHPMPASPEEIRANPALDPERQQPPRGWQREQIYAYRNRDGKIEGYKIRYGFTGGSGKTYQQASYWKDPRTGKPMLRAKSMKKPAPLYQEDQIARHPEAEIFLVEGEKTADAASRLFDPAIGTTFNSPGRRERKLREGEDRLDILKDRTVHLIADHDDAGRQNMEAWKTILQRSGAIVKSQLHSADLCREILGPRRFKKGYDLADAQEDGLTCEQVRRYREQLPENHPLAQRKSWKTEPEPEP